jgi:hypothetical protein
MAVTPVAKRAKTRRPKAVVTTTVNQNGQEEIGVIRTRTPTKLSKSGRVGPGEIRSQELSCHSHGSERTPVTLRRKKPPIGVGIEAETVIGIGIVMPESKRNLSGWTRPSLRNRSKSALKKTFNAGRNA